MLLGMLILLGLRMWFLFGFRILVMKLLVKFVKKRWFLVLKVMLLSLGVEWLMIFLVLFLRFIWMILLVSELRM